MIVVIFPSIISSPLPICSDPYQSAILNKINIYPAISHDTYNLAHLNGVGIVYMEDVKMNGS